jgi:hypothetical protein
LGAIFELVRGTAATHLQSQEMARILEENLLQ